MLDIKGELDRLHKELLFVYSEVLRVLVENPANYASPLTTLNHILGNMQHLINLMRPVQARSLGIHAPSWKNTVKMLLSIIAANKDIHFCDNNTIPCAGY